jgi:hypothetical protein
VLRPTTLLFYCGHNRSWSDSEVDVFVGLCALDSGNRYDLLILDTCPNSYRWEDYSTDMLDRLEARATHLGLPMPGHYVASWGTESATWAGEVSSHAGFRGLYWNGGEERPQVPPPTTPYHGLPWELWIPYSAGTWGIGNVARAVGRSGFPPRKISLQPNVYQPTSGRGAWDMLKCIYYAHRYGIKLEIEFDEHMHSTLVNYRWANMIFPRIFSCVYGGYKKILEIEDIF